MLYLVDIPSTVSSTSQSLICIRKIHRAAQILNVSSTPLMIWLECPWSLPFLRQGASGHYLIYQVWLNQVYSSITLSFYVDPEEALHIYLNGKDQFGSLEVLYDLINLILVRNRNYWVVCVQGVHCLLSGYKHSSTVERVNPSSLIRFLDRC